MDCWESRDGRLSAFSPDAAQRDGHRVRVRRERGEAERTTYRSAVDRNLIVEPFWDESMGDVFAESDRREAALELSDDPEDQGEWIGADGFCDTGTDMENAGGVLMHCADVGTASGSYGWLGLL